MMLPTVSAVKCLLIALLVLVSAASVRARPHSHLHPSRPSFDGSKAGHGGSFLSLSSFLSGPDTERTLRSARDLSRVEFEGDPSSSDSFSGFFTINATYNSHTFFWLIESQDGNADAPLIMWLSGGPGAGSEGAVFGGIGPYRVNPTTNSPEKVNVSWNAHAHVLFVDNPVGCGFSFTEDPLGYARDSETDVANDLYSFLSQFFTVYPFYLANDFYVAGSSYGGKSDRGQHHNSK